MNDFGFLCINFECAVKAAEAFIMVSIWICFFVIVAATIATVCVMLFKR